MLISLNKSNAYSSISAFLASYYSAVVSFLCSLLLSFLSFQGLKYREVLGKTKAAFPGDSQ